MAKRSFWSYLKAAFNARPFGMFIAPNWIGLAGFGLLGLAIDTAVSRLNNHLLRWHRGLEH